MQVGADYSASMTKQTTSNSVSAEAEGDARAFHEAAAELDDLADSVAGAEIFGGLACPHAVIYLAQVGMGAANRGCSAEGWRTEVAKLRGPEARQQLDEAEGCMRKSGLWPWQ